MKRMVWLRSWSCHNDEIYQNGNFQKNADCERTNNILESFQHHEIDYWMHPKPRPEPPALAFRYIKPGQSRLQAITFGPVWPGLFWPGLAWLLAWSWAGNITNQLTLLSHTRLINPASSCTPKHLKPNYWPFAVVFASRIFSTSLVAPINNITILYEKACFCHKDLYRCWRDGQNWRKQTWASQCGEGAGERVSQGDSVIERQIDEFHNCNYQVHCFHEWHIAQRRSSLLHIPSIFALSLSVHDNNTL